MSLLLYNIGNSGAARRITVDITFTIHHELLEDAGAPTVTMRLAEAYRELGHQVAIWSFNDLPLTQDQARNVTFPWWVAQRMLRVCMQRRVDVLDASTGDAAIFGRLRCLLPADRRPLIVTRSHGLEHTAHEALLEEVAKGNARVRRRYHFYWGGWRLRQVTASLRMADLTFVLNRPDYVYARDRLGLPEAKLRSVRNGLNANLIALPKPKPIRRNEHIAVAHIGSFIPTKGIFYLTRALSGLMHRHRHLRVAFYGTGVPEHSVRRYFPAATHDRLAVVQHFENSSLPELLANYHIAVSASISEGFPATVLEAMACGLVPVTTRTSGANEIVTDGRNGLTVPIGDCDAIERAVDALISDRALVDRLRARAFDDAQSLSWVAIARDQINYYEEALPLGSEAR